MKYKVGDTIYIRDDLKAGKKYGNNVAVASMLKHCGKKAIITGRLADNNFSIDVSESCYHWTPEMFVQSSIKQPAITISVVGRKVIARKGDKEGVARCHPDDKFDLMTGAKLALERLEEAMRIPKWLKEGTQYYMASISAEEMYHPLKFYGDEHDKRYIARGLAFRTPEEAIEAAKKMLKALEE